MNLVCGAVFESIEKIKDFEQTRALVKQTLAKYRLELASELAL